MATKLAETMNKTLIIIHKLFTTDSPPRYYGLPKIHKEGVPLRPIVSTVNTITYQCAKYLADFITPLVGQTNSYVKNS